MKKLTTILSLIAMLAIAGLAQNTRNVQDAVRSLNSKLDDVEQSFNNQMRSNSVPQGQIDVLMDDIRDLRSTVADFQSNLDRRRENRKDAQKVVESAQRLNDVMFDVASNRQMERDWQSARDQVDRIAREYGVVTRWYEGGGNLTRRGVGYERSVSKQWWVFR
jgi:chromosome segregation ATPase